MVTMSPSSHRPPTRQGREALGRRHHQLVEVVRRRSRRKSAAASRSSQPQLKPGEFFRDASDVAKELPAGSSRSSLVSAAPTTDAPSPSPAGPLRLDNLPPALRHLKSRPSNTCAAVLPSATISVGRTTRISSSSQGRQARISAAFGFLWSRRLIELLRDRT